MLDYYIFQCLQYTFLTPIYFQFIYISLLELYERGSLNNDKLLLAFGEEQKGRRNSFHFFDVRDMRTSFIILGCDSVIVFQPGVSATLAMLFVTKLTATVCRILASWR